ncbi:MAG: ABC transporter substrate-binding protein, partial [Prevotella sp.]
LMKNNLQAYVALALGLLEIILVPASWVLSVLMPDSGVRSMLGSEGVRWFLGRFNDMLCSPVMAWLLLLTIAYGCARESGISAIFKRRDSLMYRQRIARSFVIWLSFAYVVLIFALAFMPHALLLSASGTLFPSPFSASLVPVVSFGVCLISIVYAIVSGKFRGVTDVYKSLYAGIVTSAPLYLYYILLTQVYYSVKFVFG